MLEIAARIASLVLAVVLVWASLAKLVGWRAWRDALRAYGLGPATRAGAAVAVPVVEAGTALLLVAGRARLGGALSLLLLSAFSLAILRARARTGDAVPCGCFGRADERDHRLLLARNALLGALAGLVLLGGPSLAEPRAGGGELLPATLAAAGVLLIAWVVRSAGAPLWRRGG
jgi:hypothetical protein